MQTTPAPRARVPRARAARAARPEPDELLRRLHARRALAVADAPPCWPPASAPRSRRACAPAPRRTLTVAAFPLVDQIVKDAMPQWAQRHPDVAINVVMRQYDDHHTAMTTALSTGGLPARRDGARGVVRRQVLRRRRPVRPAAAALRHRAATVTRFVAYAYDQAINRKGQVVAAPTDIGPGTMLYRKDLLERAGLVGQPTCSRRGTPTSTPASGSRRPPAPT